MVVNLDALGQRGKVTQAPCIPSTCAPAARAAQIVRPMRVAAYATRESSAESVIRGGSVGAAAKAMSAGVLAWWCYVQAKSHASSSLDREQDCLAGVMPIAVAHAAGGVGTDGLDEEEKRTVSMFESASKSVLFVTNVVTGRPNV